MPGGNRTFHHEAADDRSSGGKYLRGRHKSADKAHVTDDREPQDGLLSMKWSRGATAGLAATAAEPAALFGFPGA